MPDWISVKDRLPEAGERVLLCGGRYVGEGFLLWDGHFSRYNGLGRDALSWLREASHWMPLPQPPEEGNA